MGENIEPVQIGSIDSSGKVLCAQHNRHEFQTGDYIKFENNDFGFERNFRVKITSIHNYKSFKEYLLNETLEKCLPSIDTIEQGESIYYKYYKKDDEDKYKIIAIRLKVIN